MFVNCVNDVKCGGIIIDKQRKCILCVLNKLSFLKGEHKWGFPKGHTIKNEEYWKCAQREIHEETSLYLEKKEAAIVINQKKFTQAYLAQVLKSLIINSEIRKSLSKNISKLNEKNITKNICNQIIKEMD